MKAEHGVQTRSFAERPKQTIPRHQTRAIEAAEQIALAREMRQANARGVALCF